MKLTITVTKAADGIHEYVQIMSEDFVTVNIVLVVDKIEIEDSRNNHD